MAGLDLTDGFLVDWFDLHVETHMFERVCIDTGWRGHSFKDAPAHVRMAYHAAMIEWFEAQHPKHMQLKSNVERLAYHRKAIVTWTAKALGV